MVYEVQTIGLRERNRRFVRKKPTVCEEETDGLSCKTPFIGARFTNREHTIGESFLCGKSVAKVLQENCSLATVYQMKINQLGRVWQEWHDFRSIRCIR